MKVTVRQMPWPDMEKAGQAGELELWFTGYSSDLIGDHLAYFSLTVHGITGSMTIPGTMNS